MHIVLDCAHASSCRITVSFQDNILLSVCFVPVLCHRGPSQDISSQSLRDACETMKIYRPCFCWYSLAVKIISVCTQKPVLLETGKSIQSMNTTHTPTMSRGKNLSLSLCLAHYFSGTLALFFSLAVYLSLPLPPPILHTIQRLSCFPPLPQWWTPSS